MPNVTPYRSTVTRKCSCRGSDDCKECKGSGKVTRKAGRWRIRWRDPDSGRVITKNTGAREKSVATQIAREVERQLLLDPYGLSHTKRRLIDWTDFMEEFLSYIASRNRAGTEYAYRMSLNQFSRIAKSKRVHQINAALLQDFVLQRRHQGVSAATVNKDLRAIRASLKWAEERGYIPACPRFREVFVREDVKTPVVLPVNHRQAIIQALDSPELNLTVRCAGWWRVFIELIAELGVRRGEALALTWGATDFARRELTVYSETSKGRRDRTLPISDSMVAILQGWLGQMSEAQAEDLVLPWEKKTYREFYNDWKRIIAAAGLPKGTKPVPKNFRSTCGSELIEAGTPTVVVKDFLGHASVTTTEAFYIDTGPALRSAAERRKDLHG